MALSFRLIMATTAGLCSVVAFTPAPAEAQVFRGVPVNQGGYIRYAPGPMVGGGGIARPGGFGPGIGRVPYYRPVAGGYRGPVYGGGWRGGYGGYYGRPYVGAGYYGGYYPYRRYYGGGYYPYRRYYGGYGGYYPYGGYGWGYGGGAIAAGLIGGLTLGALAASQPYYPNYYYPGAYYRTAYSPAYGTCFYERRRVVLRSGQAVVRRVRTCY